MKMGEQDVEKAITVHFASQISGKFFAIDELAALSDRP